MENHLPKISIITPSFNSGKYIEQAIQSVITQNYPNFEHVIVDGASTDDTIKILKKHQHLKWISEPDRGQSHAMNKGFAMSTGEIIVYLNADDYFEPNAFYAAVEHLNKNENVLIVVGEINTLLESGIKTTSSNTKTTFFEMLQWWKPCAYPKNPVGYFYYREVQESVGGFDEQKHHTMDYDFLLKVSLKYPISYIDHVLGNFRFIKGTKTFETQGSKYHNMKFLFSKKYYNKLKLKEKVIIYLSSPLCSIRYLYIMRVLRYVFRHISKFKNK